MLFIKSLDLKRFMNIQDAHFEFSNFNFIYGQPASGKSAIFEAISICLSDQKRSNAYGLYVMQGYDNATIKLKAAIDGIDAFFDVQLNRQFGTAFEATLEYDGQTYKNTKITEILKEKNIDYYASIMLAMQNEKDIVDQTSSSRLYYMQNLFNFSLQDEKLKLQEMISSNKNSIVELNAQKEALKQSKELFSKVQTVDFKMMTEDEKAAANARLAELSDKLAELSERENEKSSLSQELMRLQEDKLTKSGEVSKLQQMKLAKEQQDQSRKESQNEHDELSELLDKLKSQHENLSSKVVSKQFKQSQAQESKDSIDADISSLMIDISKNNAKIELIKKGFCPECGQKTDHIDDQAIERKSELDEKLSELKAKQSEAAAILKQLKDEEKDLSAQVSKIEIQYAEKLSRFETLAKELEKPAVSFDENALASRENELDSIEKKIAAIKEKLVSFKQDISLTSIHSEISAVKDKLAEDKLLQEKARSIEQQNADNKRKLEELEARDTEIDTKLVECNKLKASYDEANEIIMKLLPQYMSITICNAIQDSINSFIASIFPSYYVKIEVSKKGCEIFYTKNKAVQNEKQNKWLNVQMSSGFERAVLNLAFKTTLAKMYNIDIFIGDEIDKAASDTDSIKIIDLIWSLPNYQQVFIISHNNALKNYIFDSIEESTIYEADSGKFAKRN